MCLITNKILEMIKVLVGSTIIAPTIPNVVQHINDLKPTCPGSHAHFKHAMCSMSVNFPKPTSCSTVKNEIISRMNGDNGWLDPHNNGTYTVIDNEVVDVQYSYGDDEDQYDGQMTKITGSRVTGNGQYTDLFTFTLLEQDSSDGNTDGGGCVLNACSESQVFSILDFSTNYCNLRNLYCNSKDDGCPIVKYDLDYKETYINCWQRDATKCIPNHA